MIITQKALPRRTFLRGVGAAIALPMLDSMVPAFAAPAQTMKPPVRMAITYVPNGMSMDQWQIPGVGGPLKELSRILKPLEPYRSDLTVVDNLSSNGARAWLDGGGGHARASGAYLTCSHIRKSNTDIYAGKSMDQAVAEIIGGETRFRSIELGMDDARQTGGCDSGYGCAYTNNLSWRSPTQPMPPTLNPRLLFERLFGADANLSPEKRALRNKFRASILDFVREDTKRIESQVGPTDRRKLDQYLTSVRDIERQIERAERGESDLVDPEFGKPSGIPPHFSDHFRLMTDMVTIAFQADLTRVVTYLVTREGSARPYREIGIPDGHHPLSHHRNDPELLEKLAQINTYHVSEFSNWIGKLKAIDEGEGTLLDNSIMLYGSGISNSNSHAVDELPTILVGKGGGAVRPGRRIVCQRETPVADLFVSMMNAMGTSTERFGDSYGAVNLA